MKKYIILMLVGLAIFVLIFWAKATARFRDAMFYRTIYK
jgi:hypothetical protein